MANTKRFPVRRVAARAVALLVLALSLAGYAGPALAQTDAPTLDSGDTAWMLTSTALVLLMVIPGLALFYAGMVRKMNALAMAMQVFTITCLVTVLWMAGSTPKRAASFFSVAWRGFFTSPRSMRPTSFSVMSGRKSLSLSPLCNRSRLRAAPREVLSSSRFFLARRR